MYWCLPRHLRHERSECRWSGAGIKYKRKANTNRKMTIHSESYHDAEICNAGLQRKIFHFIDQLINFRKNPDFVEPIYFSVRNNRSLHHRNYIVQLNNEICQTSQRISLHSNDANLNVVLYLILWFWSGSVSDFFQKTIIWEKWRMEKHSISNNVNLTALTLETTRLETSHFRQFRLEIDAENTYFRPRYAEKNASVFFFINAGMLNFLPRNRCRKCVLSTDYEEKVITDN